MRGMGWHSVWRKLVMRMVRGGAMCGVVFEFIYVRGGVPLGVVKDGSFRVAV